MVVLPPIRDLDLAQAGYARDDRLAKVVANCQALIAFADRQASAPYRDDPSETAEMVERAVEVIDLLKHFRSPPGPPLVASAPAAPIARAPMRPWEDAPEDPHESRLASSPLSEHSVVGLCDSPSPRVPPAQEVHMHVFDGVPERATSVDDAIAARDMEDIRARRAAGQASHQGKVKYKKRSRASPPGQCHSCDNTETPEWRRGPDGQRTLCNACGLHYAKLVRKRDRIISALPEGGKPPPVIDINFLRKSARLASENSALARSLGRRRAAHDNKRKKTPRSDPPNTRRRVESEPSRGRKERLPPVQVPRVHVYNPAAPPMGPMMSPNQPMILPPPTASLHHPSAMHTPLPSIRMPYGPMSYPPPQYQPYHQPPPPTYPPHPQYAPYPMPPPPHHPPHSPWGDRYLPDPDNSRGPRP